ncbi:MAG: hypothetical protein Kow0059_04490 [Candidatus Sumerlaeia bacterium]
MAVVLVAVGVGGQGLGYVLLAAVLMLFALSRYLFPTHYEFTRAGMQITHLGLTQRRSWSDFKTFSVGRTGVFLSPFSGRNMLENFRGLYVLFGPDNRHEVIEFVRSALQQEA